MPSRRHLIRVMSLAAASMPAVVWPASADAMALAERMLAALGGREAWARVRTTRNDSQQNRAAEPTVVRAVITMDFVAPRLRIDTTAPGLVLARVLDHDRHWRRTRDGRVVPWPEEVLAEERRWYAAQVYRTVHRIAANDPALSLRRAQDNQLEVIEGGARLAWYRLDARGEPYAFGAHADEVGTVCGPWEHEAGGIRHPVWTARPDGTWRALLKLLEVNVPLTPELLARPEA